MQVRLGNIQFFPHNFYFDFMKLRKVWVGTSLVLVIASLLIIAVKGINYSIDFLGGAEVTVNVADAGISRQQVVSAAEKAGVGNVEVTTISGTSAVENNKGSYVLRVQREKDAEENTSMQRADTLVNSLRGTLGADKVQVVSVTNISGKVGDEEQRRGYLALGLSLLGILLYVAVRFDSRFAPGAVICLLHNVVVSLGFMTLIGRPFSVSSIAAFLTIVGYTVNDTVIVYDRIREVQLLSPRTPMVEIVNKSISQTMNRTVMTASTALFGLLVLAFLGGGTIEDFAITLFVGIIVGTYSSIYVAAPLTLMMDQTLRRYGIQLGEPKKETAKVKSENDHPPVVIRRRRTTR